MRPIWRSMPFRFSLKQLSSVGFFLATSLLSVSFGAAMPCGTWEIVATPNVGNSVTRLTAVTALSANDAWSVGLWRDVSGVFGPLAMRWNGSTWSLASLPSTGHLGGLPETAGVDAVSNGDVWVVGHVFTGYPTDYLPLVLRWRGGSWDYVATATLLPQTVYPFAPRGGLAYDVTALAPDDIWAVGQAQGFGVGATTAPMALHWDGSNWTDVEVPRVANRHHALNDVVAISTDDVWAVGDYRNIAAAYHAVTYHWDGSEWSYVHCPIEDMSESGLDDVVATGPDDVWAVGGASGVGVVLMHWDGSQWSIVPSPPNSGGSLAAVGPDDLWLSGWDGFWHWDGTTWTEVPATVPGASYVIRSGGMEIVGDCDIWNVGFWTLADGLTSFTLAERMRARLTSAPDTPGDVPASIAAIIATPNPFNPQTSVRYELTQPSAVTLRAFDLRGRLVRSLLVSAQEDIGEHNVNWDGRDDVGAELPSGTYLLRLEAGGAEQSLRVSLIR